MLDLVAARAHAAPDLGGAVAAYGFVLDSPKGLSDVGHLAIWYALFGLFGPSPIAFHAFTIACAAASVVALHALARSGGASRAQAVTGGGPPRGEPARLRGGRDSVQLRVPALRRARARGLDRIPALARLGSRASARGVVCGARRRLRRQELAFAMPAVLALDASSARRHGTPLGPHARPRGRRSTPRSWRPSWRVRSSSRRSPPSAPRPPPTWRSPTTSPGSSRRRT